MRAFPFAVCLASTLSLFATSPRQDSGASGTWHWLQKLATTASVMHTTAHPDDEHGGLLALLSRGVGARVSLLTLTRGEAGDNALGPQLFDGLGLIRTEELAVSNEYYGVDRQYFTSVVDYGFSKRLEEAFDKWGRENVLRDLVRIIRIERPLIIVSRFQGNPRDGHGNHQTAGLLTQHAFEAAADPTMFPEQMQSGLRPWRARKLFIGGMREDEDWTVRVDTGQYSAWLGDSFDNVARTGLSFQRSQNGGRLTLSSGPNYGYYKRMDAGRTAGAKEPDLFAGIDTTVPGLFRALGRPEPAGAAAVLAPIDSAVQEAMRRFDGRDPSAVVPLLAQGLAAARVAAAALQSEPDAALILDRKVEQFQLAISTALGLDLTAVAQPVGATATSTVPSPMVPPPLLGPVVPGQRFDVRVTMSNRGSVVIEPETVSLDVDSGWAVTEPAVVADGPGAGRARPTLERGEVLGRWFTVTLAADTPISTRPYFSRASIQESRYDLSNAAHFGRPFSNAPAEAVVRYRIGDVPVETRTVVRRREARIPYGYVMRELRVVPSLSLRVAPATAVVPLADSRKRVNISVEVLNNRATWSKGEL